MGARALYEEEAGTSLGARAHASLVSSRPLSFLYLPFPFPLLFPPLTLPRPLSLLSHAEAI